MQYVISVSCLVVVLASLNLWRIRDLIWGPFQIGLVNVYILFVDEGSE